MSTANSGKWQEQVQRSSKVTSKQEITNYRQKVINDGHTRKEDPLNYSWPI